MPAQAGIEARSVALEADALTTRPRRRFAGRKGEGMDNNGDRESVETDDRVMGDPTLQGRRSGEDAFVSNSLDEVGLVWRDL